MSNGVPPSQLLPQYQNPTYPEDANLTDAEIAAKMRERSMVRAHSPGELICMMDGTSRWLTPEHTHSYDEFMAYRRSHLNDQGSIIGDGDPWINWEPYDVWADHAPIPEPVPDVAQPPPTGWQPIFSVRPGGIPFPTSYVSSYWTGQSMAIEIDRSELLRYDLAVAIRLRFLMQGTLTNMYVGPRTNKPFVATSLKPLTFLGQNTITNAALKECVSDPIVGIDYRAGLHITWNTNARYGLSGVTYPLPGWHFRYYFGYVPTINLDKSAWFSDYNAYIFGLFFIDALFLEHPEAIPLQVFQRYSIGSPDFGTAQPPRLLT